MKNGIVADNSQSVADLNAEAIRVIKSLPNFIPGKQGGKNVKVQYIIPIQFALGDNAVQTK